jgi:hypothetical protein
VVGANSFSLLPYARIAGIIWLARTAVKVERSEFILNLDGGRSQPYRFCPGKGQQRLRVGRDLYPVSYGGFQQIDHAIDRTSAKRFICK